VGQNLASQATPACAGVSQNVVLNFALKAKAAPTTANSATDNNIIFILFIKKCFLNQKAKLCFWNLPTLL